MRRARDFKGSAMSPARNRAVAASRDPDRRRKGVAHHGQEKMKMPMMSVTRIAVLVSILGSTLIAHAADNYADGIKSRPGSIVAAAAAMPSPKQAPVGHRQPRIGDIPVIALSPFDLELRREDALIDSKIIICRGC